MKLNERSPKCFVVCVWYSVTDLVYVWDSVCGSEWSGVRVV